MTEIGKFDVAVLGAGPGGYPAAIRAAQRGAKVALVEALEVGGTCLNRGCIPSKALIANGELYRQIQKAEDFGIAIGEISFKYGKMAQRKDEVVSKMKNNLEKLIAANQITLISGYGRFASSREIKIQGKDAGTIYADNIIIATGSEPREIAAFPFDHEKIHDSTSLLNLKELPESIVIIGGGVIGCEFASLYRSLGAEVTILELLPRILPMEAEEISQALARSFKKRGIEVKTGVAVESIRSEKNGVEAIMSQGGPVQADIALVSVGRSLNTSDIGLEKAGLAAENSGMIKVNDRMETEVAGIYAVGDIASRWWLAHVATHQGMIAAENATGGDARMHYHAVPSVIFTDPEIGSVGLSLEAAKEKGYKAVVGAFPFQALGKAQAAMHAEGFAQVVIDQATGQILGAQIFGYEATSLIAEMTVAIANELTVDCIADTIHAHPTYSESWMEASLIASGMPLHLPPVKKSQRPTET